MRASLELQSADEHVAPINRSDYLTGSGRRRMRLLALSVIVLSHLLLFFCWPSPRRSAEQSVAHTVLNVWNITLPATKMVSKEQAPELSPSLAARAGNPVKKKPRPATVIAAKAKVPAGSGSIAASIATSTGQQAMPSEEKVPGAPVVDFNSVTKQVLVMDQHREISPIERMNMEQRPRGGRFEAAIGDAADSAQRKDCQTAYAGAGLLAIVPLLVDTVTNSGCKWK